MATRKLRTMSDTPPTALAMYGTLRPGEPNHWVVRSIAGTWTEGTIRGWAFDVTWGAAAGCPGLVLDPEGPLVEVSVLRSDRLPSHLQEIDDFEGPGYRRVETDVALTDGTVITAAVYEAIQDNVD